jgi:hypothetical protein
VYARGNDDDEYAEGNNNNNKAKSNGNNKPLNDDDINEYAEKGDFVEGGRDDKPLAKDKEDGKYTEGNNNDKKLTNNKQPKTQGHNGGGKGEEVVLGLILDNAGVPAIIVFVNSAGIPLSRLPLAAVVHISAGQKEEAPADNR